MWVTSIKYAEQDLLEEKTSLKLNIWADLQKQALPSDWAPGGEVVPTDFTSKVAYFLKKFGEGSKMTEEENTVENNMEDEVVMEEVEESKNSGPQQKQEESNMSGTNPFSKG